MATTLTRQCSERRAGSSLVLFCWILRIALPVVAALSVISSLSASEPFEVSLDYASGRDLSEHYQAVIRNATEQYRGDGNIVLARHYLRSSFRFPEMFVSEEIVEEALARHFYLYRVSSSGAREVVSELHLPFEPFPPMSLALRLRP